jgi:hypothetical protein
VYPVWKGREEETQWTRPGMPKVAAGERAEREKRRGRSCGAGGDAQMAAVQEKAKGEGEEGTRGTEERKREKRRERKVAESQVEGGDGAEEERTVKMPTRRPTKNQ